MKVLMVEPGKVPYAAEIGEGLEPLQAAVGGDIQAVYPYDDPVARSEEHTSELQSH